MSIIQSIDQESSQAAEYLRQLLSVLVLSNEKLDNKCQEISSESGNWMSVAESIGVGFTAFTSLAASGKAGIEQELSTTIAAVQAFVQSATSADTELEHHGQELQSLSSELGTEVTSHSSQLDDAFSQLQNIAQQMTAQCATSHESLGAIGDGVIQLFTELKTSATSVQDRTSASTDGLLQELGELISDVSGQCAETAETAIADFSSEIEGTLTQTLQSNLEETAQQLKEGFSTFASTSDEHVQELISSVTGSAEGAVDVLRDTISSEVQGMCDNVVNDMINAFAEEVQADMAVMQVGAQVTSVLGPILPELKAAEMVLSAVNSVLDMFE